MGKSKLLTIFVLKESCPYYQILEENLTHRDKFNLNNYARHAILVLKQCCQSFRMFPKRIMPVLPNLSQKNHFRHARYFDKRILEILFFHLHKHFD